MTLGLIFILSFVHSVEILYFPHCDNRDGQDAMLMTSVTHFCANLWSNRKMTFSSTSRQIDRKCAFFGKNQLPLENCNVSVFYRVKIEEFFYHTDFMWNH